MFADFHFLHPQWFLALIPLCAILWTMVRRGAGQNTWQRVVDAHLLPYLLVEGAGSARWLPRALAAAGWFAAVIALANPTYERRPVPALRPMDARVVVLDLSQSMEAADLKPSRLARARYKVADILNRSRDGQVGLIVFAGDAFVVAPLSDDADTLLGMLDALSPEVMPVRGSRPDLGLVKAGELLTQAGAREGEVILVGDDAGDDRALAAATDLRAQGRRVSVIGVGTGEGAPVPGARDPDGKPVLAQLDMTNLEGLARAGGGGYATLTADAADLDLVLHRQPGRTGAGPGSGPAAAEAEQWEGLGPWFTLALLPLAALAFRRGWLMGAALSLVLAQGALTPRPALAVTWNDLWQRPDQQAAAALAQGDPQRALDLAAQPDQRGTASYRLGDYQSAAETFAAAGDADGDYNRGNALALSGRLEEAIAAYDEALRRRPGTDDALYNKARVEELLKQQEQQEQQQQQQQQSGSGEGSQDQSNQPRPGEESAADANGERTQGEQGDAEHQSQAGQSEEQQGQSSQAQEKPQDAQGAESGSGEQQAEGGGQDQAVAEQGAEQDQSKGPSEGQRQGQQAQAGASPDDQDAPQAKDAEARRAQAEQAAEDYSAEAARHGQARPQEPGGEPEGEKPGSLAEADLPPEEREARQAADQWLRRIPDDPSGLLRRKFLYQYRQRNQQGGVTTSGDPW